jgi:hypothetical protein
MEDTLPEDIALKRQRIHRLLTGIILMTLPCYACGIILLIGFGGRQPTSPSPTATVEEIEELPDTNTPAGTPTLTYTPGGPTVTLPFTPTQFFPPTITPTPSITLTTTGTTTPVPPTNTIPPTITVAPSDTPSLTPTETSVPTLTPTSTFTPSELTDEEIQQTAAAAALTQAALDLTATAEAEGGNGNGGNGGGR